MSENKLTLGEAIDQIVGALESLGEGARQTAINAACEHIGISSPATAKNASAIEHPATIARSSATISTAHTVDIKKSQDIRSLKEEKAPKSGSQMACVVAYYLQELAPEGERKNIINAKDIEKYFKQAKFKLPKTITQLLPDSKGSGYFDSAAGKGNYSLNAVGYNLVAHNLPRKASN